jgi:hypothetical protein
VKKIKPALLKPQRGATLMIMLIILTLGITTFLLSSLNPLPQRMAKEQISRLALAQAKEALIGYAASYADSYPGEVHGYLPCPDEGQNNSQDGTANSPCGARDVSRLGKLPWRTLGLPPLKDGEGECLWYAVSGSSKNSPKTQMMNEETRGLFEVIAADGSHFIAGSTPENRAVAIIFSPGKAQNSQNHASLTKNFSCGGNNIASNYLDSDTLHLIDNSVISSLAATVSRFIAGPIKDSTASSQLTDTLVNDRLLVITQGDIFNAIRHRTDY